jgi:hypothetical protein
VIRKLLILTGLLVVTGCAPFMATSQEFYYHDEAYAVRRTADEVDVYREGTPRTPYVVLGRIVATQGMFGSRESVIAELRARAAGMGADALINLTESKGALNGPNPPSSESTRYNQEGNVSTSESWNQDSKASIRLTISALAIRYQSP